MRSKEVAFAGIIQGQEEREAVLRVLDSKWHGSGYECDALEKELALYVGTKYAVVVNSGSSANLLAILALGLPKGSKILTSACGFPATLSPILHAGHVPVLVDYSLPSHNIDLNQVEVAIDNDPDIKAVISAHTMANPVDMTRLLKAAYERGIYVVEDCCEALGSAIGMRWVGSFGDLGTFSFYSSHQINGLGGGGAVVTNNKNIALNIRSMKEWGKLIPMDFEGDHKTRPTEDVDGIPYDLQYTYVTQGFNMKWPDVNCAYARIQLQRLGDFNDRRRANYIALREMMRELDKYFIPMEQIPAANLANFGYILTLREDAPFTRDELLEHLENNQVRTRMFFAGNILRQSAFRGMRYYSATEGAYPVADYLMRNSLYVGVWPGLDQEDMKYIAETIKEFIEAKRPMEAREGAA